MPSDDFRCEVDDAFTITGRPGTTISGRIVAGRITSGDTAYLHTGAAVIRVDGVALDSTSNAKRVGLLLPGVVKAEILPGSVLLARAE